MLELPVTAARSHELPTVILKQTKHLAYFI
jgi:hypothetical protein